MRTVILMIFMAVVQYLSAQNNPDLAYSNIDKSLLKNAYSIIRWNNSRVVIDDQDELKIYRDFAVTAKSEKGASALVFVEGYKEKTSEIKDIKITLYDSEGNEIEKIGKGDIVDYSQGDGFSIITDSRIKAFQYEAKDYPVTMHVTYTYKSSTTAFLPSFDPYLSNTRVSVEKAILGIENKSDGGIDSKTVNGQAYKIMNPAPLNYIVENLPAIRKEKYMPPMEYIFPKVHFNFKKFKFQKHKGEIKDWASAGMWNFNALLSPTKSWDDENMKTEIYKIVSPDLSSAEIVRKIYKYVQDNTRYISISLKDGGLKPMDPKEVHSLKYGDCKALSFYTNALLDLYGIPSNYVVVQAESDYPHSFYEDFASLAQGNHIIVNVPLESDTIWLDCTTQNYPAGYLGPFTDKRIALEVSAEGGKLTRTPSYDTLNSSMLEANFDINQTKFNIKVNLNHHGEFMLATNQNGVLSQEDRMKYVLAITRGKIRNLKISEFSSEYNREDWSVKEEILFSGEGLTELAGDYLLINGSVLDFDIPSLKKDKRREYPIYFPRTYRQGEKITITIPEGYKVYNMPDNIMEETKYGTFSASFINHEDHIEVHTLCVQYAGDFAAEEYNAIKGFYDGVKKKLRRQITLQKK